MLLKRYFRHIATWKQQMPNLWIRNAQTQAQTSDLLLRKSGLRHYIRIAFECTTTQAQQLLTFLKKLLGGSCQHKLSEWKITHISAAQKMQTPCACSTINISHQSSFELICVKYISGEVNAYRVIIAPHTGSPLRTVGPPSWWRSRLVTRIPCLHVTKGIQCFVGGIYLFYKVIKFSDDKEIDTSKFLRIL